MSVSSSVYDMSLFSSTNDMSVGSSVYDSCIAHICNGNNDTFKCTGFNIVLLTDLSGILIA